MIYGFFVLFLFYLSSFCYYFLCRSFFLSFFLMNFMKFLVENFDATTYTSCLHQDDFFFFDSFGQEFNIYIESLVKEADRLVKAYFEFRDLVPHDTLLRAIYFDDFKDWNDELKAKFVEVTGSLERSISVFNCISEMDNLVRIMPKCFDSSDTLFKGIRTLFFSALLEEDMDLDNDKTSLLFKNKNFIVKFLECCYSQHAYLDVPNTDLVVLVRFRGFNVLSGQERILNFDWVSDIINQS